MELKWNVFYHNINKNKIETFNIFDHYGFREDVQKHLKKIKDKNEFAEELRKSLSYFFRCKSEYEIVITSFPSYITIEELTRLNDEKKSHKEKYGCDAKILDADLDTEIKVDIYTQIINNFEIFVDYCWNSKR